MNTIGIICMVKNESEKIIETLKPLVEFGFTNFLINDTGSTDDTCEKISSNINNAILIRTKFDGYANSRNMTLRAAKAILTDVKYLLFLDCEWYSKNILSLVNFVENITDHSYDFYETTILMSDGIINKLPRLINVSCKFEFEGHLHETLNGKNGGLIPDFYFNVIQSEYGLRKTRIRNIEYDIPHYLSIENKSDMDYFYLAQAYHNTMQYIEAIDSYLRVNGFLKYISLYRIGECYISLKEYNNAFFFYSNCILVNPKRCEPFVRIAQLHNDENKYNFAKIAFDLVKDINDVFVDSKIYDIERYVEYCKGCIINKQFKEGLSILNKYIPDNEDLRKKLSRKIIILILNSPGYTSYNDKMREHLNKFDIKYYFYSYSNSIDSDYEIIDDQIFIKGEESFIPGILNKTIKVFQIFKNYDYIIRLNATSILDLTKVDFDNRENIDYFGYLNSVSVELNEPYGITQEFLSKNGSIPFVSGKCIILSKKAIKILLESEIDYKIMDDIAISLVLNKKFPIEHKNSFGLEDSILKSM